MSKINVGLYGINGHQIHELLLDNERAYCGAIAGIDKSRIPKEYLNDKSVKIYGTFEELIADEDVDVVSICSDIRKNQEHQAIAALEAGKHVYSEKPAALSEEALEMILATAKRVGKEFHEMADTAFLEPFMTIRDVVKSGVLGEIVQVYAQKSYPYHERRPQDDVTDGGLIRWIGIHAARFIEHTTGLRTCDVHAVETTHGNPVKNGELVMASSIILTLENGAVGSMNLNYLNHRSFGTWGNEHLRIWGTDGFVETTDGCTKTRLVLKDEDKGPLDLKYEDRNYFEYVLDKIIDGKEMPISLEEELHPLRTVIRAKNNVIGRCK